MYQRLSNVAYNQLAELENELQSRINNPACIHTNLFIHPYSLQKQVRLTEKKYELFCVLLPEMAKLKDDIFLNSIEIQKIVDLFPREAKLLISIKQMVSEIQSTNEIEGVKSTRKEINDAYKSSNPNRRFNGIVNSYRSINEGKIKKINNVNQFREIYDEMLIKEIDEKSLPDGKLFRKEVVYITGSSRYVHQGDPSEEIIIKNLESLIIFMNDSNLPIIIKAIITHYFFEYIHPFYDGNGRMGRFLFSNYVARKLDLFTGLSLSPSIINNKKKYEDAFLLASNPKNFGELTFFVLDLMEMIKNSQLKIIKDIKTLQSRLNSAKGRLRKIAGKDKTMEDILNIMFVNSLLSDFIGYSSNKELASLAKISRSTVDRRLKELETENYVTKVSAYPVTYRLSDDLLEE